MTPRDILDMFRRKGGARCIEIGRLIQSYLDGELDAASTAKVSQHLQACRRCGLTADDYRSLKVALAQTLMPLPTEPLARLQSLATRLTSGDTTPS